MVEVGHGSPDSRPPRHAWFTVHVSPPPQALVQNPPLARLSICGLKQAATLGCGAEGSTSDELGPFLAGVGPRGSDELSSLRTGLEGPSSRPSTLQNLNFTVQGRVQRVSCGSSYTLTRHNERGNGKHLGKNIERAEFRPTSAFCIVPMPLLPNPDVMLGELCM